MAYPNVRKESAETIEIGRAEFESKVKEIKKFIDENHTDEYGNITNELHEVIESLGYEFFGN